MSSPKVSILLNTLLLFTPLIHAFTPAIPILSQNLKRAALSGGFGLFNPACSQNNAQRCSFESCCPNELECVYAPGGSGYICCPTGTKCLAAYQASPRCADDSWTLWRIGKSDEGEGYFCCLAGQIGTNSNTCVSNDTPVVASLSASLVATGTGVAAEPSTANATASVTSTATKSSAASKATGVTAATTTLAGSSESTSTQGAQVTKTGGVGRVGVGSLGGGVIAVLGVVVGAM